LVCFHELHFYILTGLILTGEKSSVLNKYIIGYMRKSECLATTEAWEALRKTQSLRSAAMSFARKALRNRDVYYSSCA
jgi:hypothetical protein